MSCVLVEPEHGRGDPCVFLNITLEKESHHSASFLFSICLLCPSDFVASAGATVEHHKDKIASCVKLIFSVKENCSRRNCDRHCQMPTKSSFIPCSLVIGCLVIAKTPTWKRNDIMFPTYPCKEESPTGWQWKWLCGSWGKPLVAADSSTVDASCICSPLPSSSVWNGVTLRQLWGWSLYPEKDGIEMWDEQQDSAWTAHSWTSFLGEKKCTCILCKPQLFWDSPISSQVQFYEIKTENTNIK